MRKALIIKLLSIICIKYMIKNYKMNNIIERLNKKFSALKGMASSNIVQEATRQALESIDY